MKRVACLLALALPTVCPAGVVPSTFADACQVSYPPGTNGEIGCLIEVSTPPPPPPPGAVTQVISIGHAGTDQLRVVRQPPEVHFNVCAEWPEPAGTLPSILTMLEIDLTREDNPIDKSMLVLSVNNVRGQTYLSVDWSSAIGFGTSLLASKPWAALGQSVAVFPVNACPKSLENGTEVEVLVKGAIVSVRVDEQVVEFSSDVGGDTELSHSALRFYPFAVDNADGAKASMYWRFRPAAG